MTKFLFCFNNIRIDEYIEGNNMLKNTYSQEEIQKFKVGAIVFLILLTVLTFFITSKAKIKKNEDASSIYSIVARFNRTDGLLKGDAVRMAGLNIGTVADTKLDQDFKAVLTLNINKNVHIPEDSSAAIVSSAVMGPKYIEIVPGGSEDFLSPNAEFEYTQDAMVIEELVDRIISIGKSKKTQKQGAN